MGAHSRWVAHLLLFQVHVCAHVACYAMHMHALQVVVEVAASKVQAMRTELERRGFEVAVEGERSGRTAHASSPVSCQLRTALCALVCLPPAAGAAACCCCAEARESRWAIMRLIGEAMLYARRK